MERSTAHKMHPFKSVHYEARDPPSPLFITGVLDSIHEALYLMPNRKEARVDRSVLSCIPRAVLCKCFCIFIWNFLYVLGPVVG